MIHSPIDAIGSKIGLDHTQQDPIEARAQGFFLISQITIELAEVIFKLAHYRRTTFAKTSQWGEEIIISRLSYESIYEYLEGR